MKTNYIVRLKRYVRTILTAINQHQMGLQELSQPKLLDRTQWVPKDTMLRREGFSSKPSPQ
jgi:uncharacterized protein YqgQ